MNSTTELVDLTPDWLDPAHAVELAQEHGTPLYVYSRNALLQQADEAMSLGAPFGSTTRFAMKANPNDEVLSTFLDAGLHIDASSGHEAIKAMHIGFEASKIMITSQMIPKNFEQLVEEGVRYNATSLHQLETYCSLFPGTEVSVRINPPLGSGMNNRTNTGGVNSSFGIWHEYIPLVLEVAESHDVAISGLHTHIGSGADPQAWEEATETSLSIAEQLPKVTTIDLGGGFKVARIPGEKSANMTRIGERVSESLKNFALRTGRELHLEIEPGTFLVANSGVLIAEVIDKKDTGNTGHNFTLIDSGMGDLARPAMYGAQHPLTVIRSDGTLPVEGELQVVAGRHCESGDILTPAPGNPEEIEPRFLGKAAIGDLLVIGGAGAYGATMGATGYCGYEPAKEILI